MIFVTGDTHGSFDKLEHVNFTQSKKLTRNDYVLIAGDFGLMGYDLDNHTWLRWLEQQNFTTLFIDGNHDNHTLLDSLPVTLWNGGKVHILNNGIVHLMRGQVYNIDGLKFFTFGGADSIDKLHRITGISWWAREMPSYSEYSEGLENLDKHNWDVDYVFTHACSSKTFDNLSFNSIGVQKYETDLNTYFDTIEEKLEFKHWYFGHYHMDSQIDYKHTVVYQRIIRIS